MRLALALAYLLIVSGAVAHRNLEIADEPSLFPAPEPPRRGCVSLRAARRVHPRVATYIHIRSTLGLQKF